MLAQVSLFQKPLVKVKLGDLMAATNSFSSENIIVTTRTGTRYTAILPDGSALGVKHLSECKLGEKEFRLVRAVDYTATFAANRHRQGVVLDEAAARLGAFEHPVQRLPSGSRVPGSLIGGNYTSWRPVRGNGSGHRGPRGHSPMEPMSRPRPRRGGKAGASRSLLPSWWPRGNLSDITHIMRRISRKGKPEALAVETSTTGVLQTPVASALAEHSSVMVTPAPAVGLKRSGPASTASLRKRVRDYINKEIAAGEEEGAGFITPQKMLLNSIEMVEKLVTSELHRMQSTREREERETVVKHLVSLK
ncbi:hypothetical protein YC2023_083004 [Brassica napus]